MKKRLVLAGFLFVSLGLAMTEAQASVPAVRVHNQITIWMDSQPDPDVTILFACDSLEDRTRDLLNRLGATNVSVMCAGDGDIDRPTYSPLLSIKFDSLKLPTSTLVGAPTTGEWEAIRLRDHSDCETTRQLVNGIKKYFELQNVNGLPNSCYQPEAPYLIQFSVLR